MKQKLKGLLIGLTLGAVISSTTAFAANETFSKDITYRNIKIVVDTNEITPTDANGNYVEPFIMDGTTYLPVRAVANAFDKDVSWNDTTNTVYIDNNQSVVGVYTTTYPIFLTLTLTEDNTGNVTNGEQTVDLTWVQNENQLTLTPVDTELETEVVTMDGNRLIFDGDVIFTKKTETATITIIEPGTLQKDVTYRDIKIVVDGNEITPTDANGNPVEPFIMDGTTYLPVRAVANAFGKEVGWDDTNSTVYISAPSETGNNLVGNYILTNIEGIGESYPEKTMSTINITVKGDGTGSLFNGFEPINFTWTKEDNKLTFVSPQKEEPMVLIVNNNQLLTEEVYGITLIFTKTDNSTIESIDSIATITMKSVTVDKTDANKPIVTIEMENGGIIKAELYPDVAPITVENFISLIEKGFYDGLTFHRNIPGFVIQGGCPVGNGTGGPGYTIKGEFSSNGVKNDLKHTRGVLSMARAMDPDSAGSQFFIMHADAPHLDGEYTAFGMVVEGMDVVDSIANSGM